MKKVLSLLVLAGALGLTLGCGGSPTTPPKVNPPAPGGTGAPAPPGGSGAPVKPM
jgi:hypothetical protein